MNVIDQLDINIVFVCITAIVCFAMAFIYRKPEKITEAIQKIENDPATLARLETGYDKADPNVKAIVELLEKAMYFMYVSTPTTGSVLSGFKEPVGEAADFFKEVSDGVAAATKVTPVVRDGEVKFEQKATN